VTAKTGKKRIESRSNLRQYLFVVKNPQDICAAPSLITPQIQRLLRQPGQNTCA
jgi:hypothetical protein